MTSVVQEENSRWEINKQVSCWHLLKAALGQLGPKANEFLRVLEPARK